ncbi:hypothetical protein JOF53_001184 [Crossiella equi]|uniref:Phosphoribosyltransferase n=1 Tax=Crossiella equi TaxID=130796 RepID=A0ABS5A6T8_9PSEU|nr:hypothetical protein [Crossiella equi]MBP2472312.1 hypothetical protein [Crossiella equi]
MISQVGGSTVRNIGDESGCGSLHIVDNEPLRTLLFDRNLTGLPFRETCLEISRHFVGHVADEINKDDTVELLLLSKGLVYQLPVAVALELRRNLPVNLVATSRLKVLADDAKVDVSYARFDAPGSTLLIGDTVASGATVVAALEAYRSVHRVEELYVFSCAGATTGARRIEAYCQANGIRCTLLFGLAAFGLGHNGFDLSFLHPETITEPRYRELARAQFDGQAVSAVGWDFGSQAMSPAKYARLCWVEAEVHGLHGSPGLAREERPERLDALAREQGAFGEGFRMS